MKAIFTAAALAGLVACSADTPLTDDWVDARWKGQHAGEATTVMTLASTHLSQSFPSAPPDMLEPLLGKLEAFAPDAITHENLSGEQCDHIRRYPSLYQDVFDGYCFDTSAAEAATGLDVPGAVAQVRLTLIDWPDRPTPSDRRRLVSLFLAAGEPASALVQWLQLPEAERVAGDGLTAGLRDDMLDRTASINESYSIAATLAARLGHDRIYPVDDHTADGVYYTGSSDSLGDFLSAHWSSERPAFYDELTAREKSVATGADMLDFYRHMNRLDVSRQFVELDFLGAAKTPSDGNHGRTYLAWWEVRNMRMAANIRSVAAQHHGGRVLNVVGASHKAHYDLYLDLMADMDVVDTLAVLD